MGERHIRDLNIVGSGNSRRVETKDMTQDNPEVTFVYPRPSSNLGTEDKARIASLAAKSLAHLGFSGASEANRFAADLFAKADSEAKAKAEAASSCDGEVVTIKGKQYRLTAV